MEIVNWVITKTLRRIVPLVPFEKLPYNTLTGLKEDKTKAG